jgi:glycogen operon protein
VEWAIRDDVRAFVRGEGSKVGALMQRLYGSDDLFPDGPLDVYRPFQSVNFITAHDGFCLYDLVAYDRKHNEANGHGNNDGTSDNRSWNCGWEGDQCVPGEVLTLRRRQVKNFFTLLMLANGTPMFCAGDEFLNTQGGNNNPYNQDNETTWLDWSLLGRAPGNLPFSPADDRISQKPRAPSPAAAIGASMCDGIVRMARWTLGQSRAPWPIASVASASKKATSTS